MALDNHTYGFSKDDAEDLLREIQMGETEVPEFVPRGGGSGGGARLVRFEMQEGWSMSNVAAASIYEMDGSLGPGASVRDPEGIFVGLALGDTGLAIHQDGENWAIQANCPSEED